MLKRFLNAGTKLTPLFAIGLFALVPLSVQAQNQAPEFSFHPAMAWDTRAIEKNGHTICSIATEMNNGFILQITGAHQRFQTINLNFRQNVFADKKNVDISLSVPGMITKTLPAFIAKPELIAIDTKTHQDLMAAMRQAKVLDVHVGQNAFRFYLTGLAQGLAPFDKCMEKDGTAIMAQNTASTEPQRQAPSPSARKGADKAQQQYENEMALLMGSLSADNKGTVPIKEIIPQQDKPAKIETVTPDLEKKPIQSRTRFTERLAAEMAKAEGDSLTGGVQIPKASSPPAKAAQQKTTMPKTDTFDGPVSLPQRTEAANDMNAQSNMSAIASATKPVTLKSLTTESLADETKTKAHEAAPTNLTSKDVQTIKEQARAQLENRIPQKVNVEQNAQLTMAHDKIPSAEIKPAQHPKASVAAQPVKIPVNAPEATQDKISSTDTATTAEKEAITWHSKRVTPDKAPAQTNKSATHNTDLPPLDDAEKTIKSGDTTNETASVAPAPASRKFKTHEPTINKRSAKIEADFTDAGVVKSDAPAMEVTVNPVKPASSFDDAALSQMQKDLETLRAENIQLNKELEKSLRAAEKERLDVSTDNWNLEQATMRYNEAERQIAALGQKIQKERAQWEMERAELEMMLFDPAVTEQAQLARLATLENQLNETKQQLELQRSEYEERLRQMRVTMQRSAPASQ